MTFNFHFFVALFTLSLFFFLLSVLFSHLSIYFILLFVNLTAFCYLAVLSNWKIFVTLFFNSLNAYLFWCIYLIYCMLFFFLCFILYILYILNILYIYSRLYSCTCSWTIVDGTVEFLLLRTINLPTRQHIKCSHFRLSRASIFCAIDWICVWLGLFGWGGGQHPGKRQRTTTFWWKICGKLES